MPAPRRAIVGNWVHEYPDDGYPGPNLDWLHEMVRFFDQWLKGVDNGYLDRPILTWFRREWAPPEPSRVWPGTWVARADVPAAGARETSVAGRRSCRCAGGLRQAAADGGVERFLHRATTGTRAALSWGAGSRRTAWPGTSAPRTRSSRPSPPHPWRSRSRSSGSRRRTWPGDPDAGRDGGGPAGGRRAGRHRRPSFFATSRWRMPDARRISISNRISALWLAR